MNKTVTTYGGIEEGGESHGESVNLPDERTESNLKNIIFRYLKNNVPFTGDPVLVDEKVRELTVGLYDIAISLRE